MTRRKEAGILTEVPPASGIEAPQGDMRMTSGFWHVESTMYATAKVDGTPPGQEWIDRTVAWCLAISLTLFVIAAAIPTETLGALCLWLGLIK